MIFFVHIDDDLPYVEGQVESEPAIGTCRNDELVVTNMGYYERAVSLVRGISALKCSVAPLTQTIIGSNKTHQRIEVKKTENPRKVP